MHRYVIAFFAILIIVVIIYLGSLFGKRSLSNSEKQFAAALFEFQEQFTTNGNKVVSPALLPASIIGLQVNSIQVGSLAASVSKIQSGPFGIVWAKGIRIKRQTTNDNVWSLNRVYSFTIPRYPSQSLDWSSVITTVTNVP